MWLLPRLAGGLCDPAPKFERDFEKNNEEKKVKRLRLVDVCVGWRAVFFVFCTCLEEGGLAPCTRIWRKSSKIFEHFRTKSLRIQQSLTEIIVKILQKTLSKSPAMVYNLRTRSLRQSQPLVILNILLKSWRIAKAARKVQLLPLEKYLRDGEAGSEHGQSWTIADMVKSVQLFGSKKDV